MVYRVLQGVQEGHKKDAARVPQGHYMSFFGISVSVCRPPIESWRAVCFGVLLCGFW